MLLAFFVLGSPLSAANSAESCGKPTVWWYTCPEHSQVILEESGKCPICLSDLIPVYEPVQEKVRIPEGELLQFCETYITEAIAGIENLQSLFESGQIHAIMTSYVELYGDNTAEQLRTLLRSSNLYCVEAAAYHLGKMGDTKSVPILKGLLTAKDMQLPAPTFSCPNHFDDIFDSPGNCPKCKAVLFETMPRAVLYARLSIAGALYVMGEPAGLRALKDILKKPYGGFAYGVLALRDTKEGRELLATGAQSEYEYTRLQAMRWLFELGDITYIDQTIKFLDSSNESIRYLAIDALAKSKYPKAQGALIKLLQQNDISSHEQLVAAEGLVLAGKKEYIELIIDTCTNIADDQDASTAFWALGEVAGKEVEPLLRKTIENNPQNRLWAVAATIKILKRKNYQRQ